MRTTITAALLAGLFAGGSTSLCADETVPTGASASTEDCSDILADVLGVEAVADGDAATPTDDSRADGEAACFRRRFGGFGSGGYGYASYAYARPIYGYGGYGYSSYSYPVYGVPTVAYCVPSYPVYATPIYGTMPAYVSYPVTTSYLTYPVASAAPAATPTTQPVSTPTQPTPAPPTQLAQQPAARPSTVPASSLPPTQLPGTTPSDGQAVAPTPQAPPLPEAVPAETTAGLAMPTGRSRFLSGTTAGPAVPSDDAARLIEAVFGS